MLPNWLYGKSLKKLQEILNSGGQTAAGVSYSNTESGLEATNAQAAIDEVVEELDTKAAQSALTTLSDTVTTLTGTVNGKVGWSDYAQLGAVNLLSNTATAQTLNTITFTVNDDKSITFSGTASSNTYLTIGSFTLPAGTYKLSGAEGGTQYKVDIQLIAGGNILASDYGNDATFTLESSTAITARIRVENAYAITDSLTFYPMITPVSYTGSYVPYAKTNAELTSDVTDLTTLESGEATGTVTFSQNKIHKRGNIVTVEVEFTADADYAAYTNVITIPLSFRRSTGTMGYPYGILINRSANAVGYATLFGSGSVQFSAGIETGNICRLTMTYLV